MRRINGLLIIVICVAAFDAPAEDAPWFRKCLVGMEVGPTGAQFGADMKDNGYAARFNGADVVRANIEANSEYLVIWGKDSEYAYYNSKVAPKCPGLGERDVIQEAVDAARPHGLPVIVYCVVQGNGYPLRDDPEYKMAAADGTSIDRICLNSGYIDHAKAVVAEMLAYDIQGFHIDMLDQGFGPPYGCWCANCRARFEQEYGEPMPPGVTWDAAWDKMMQFRYDTSERFERELLAHIRALSPKVSVDFNYHGYPPFSWEVGQRPVQHAHIGDFVTCESGVWGFSALGAGLTAQFTRATDPAAPYQVVMQRGVRMYHDQTVRPVNDMRWEMFALLANGAQVTIVDKAPFDGSIDPVAYARMGQVFAEARAKREHFGHASVQDVGLYYSCRTRDWYGRENPSKYEQSFFGAHKALVYEHIPYGVILDENVTLERLRAFPVVLLADTAILSPEEVALFTQYVEQGGNLIVSGISGLYGRMGEPLDHSVLEPLTGARMVEVLKDNDNFFQFSKDPEGVTAFERNIPLDWPVLAYGPAVRYEAVRDSRRCAGVLRRPVRTLRQQQGLEGVSFPSSAGEAAGPAVLMSGIGKGTVVTLAVSPGAAVASEYRTVEARILLRNAIYALLPDTPEIQIDAPRNVETVVTDDPAARILRVHCVAYLAPPGTTSPTRPMLLPDLVEDTPVYKMRLAVKRPLVKIEALSPATKTGLDGAVITAEIEDIHEVLLLHY